MRITFTFASRPGDAQLEAMTLRADGLLPSEALRKTQLFVQSITTIPIARVTIDFDAPQS